MFIKLLKVLENSYNSISKTVKVIAEVIKINVTTEKVFKIGKF